MKAFLEDRSGFAKKETIGEFWDRMWSAPIFPAFYTAEGWSKREQPELLRRRGEGAIAELELSEVKKLWYTRYCTEMPLPPAMPDLPAACCDRVKELLTREFLLPLSEAGIPVTEEYEGRYAVLHFSGCERLCIYDCGYIEVKHRRPGRDYLTGVFYVIPREAAQEILKDIYEAELLLLKEMFTGEMAYFRMVE